MFVLIKPQFEAFIIDSLHAKKRKAKKEKELYLSLVAGKKECLI